MQGTKDSQKTSTLTTIGKEDLILIVVDSKPIPTLAKAYEEFKAFKTDLKDTTKKQYDQSMYQTFKKWHEKLITEINQDDVLYYHKLLSNRHSMYGKGEALADRAFRTLRAVLNWSMHRYRNEEGNKVLIENPVDVLGHLKAWNKRKPRKTMIKQFQLPTWWRAVGELRDRSASDWLKFILLTGLRRNEALYLTWDNMNFGEKTITITDTKNGDTHTLPLTDYLFAMLVNRYNSRPKRQFGHANPYVFYSQYTNSRGGALNDRMKCLDEITIYTGIEWHIHDLRRNFAAAAVETDVSEMILKKLLNHRTSLNHDVTYKHYLGGLDVQALRDPMQRITDRLLVIANVDKQAEITRLQSEPTSHTHKLIAPKPRSTTGTYKQAQAKKEILTEKFKKESARTNKPRVRLSLQQVKDND